MAFELPPLPYDYSALEPHIDTQTMQIHHDKHHAAYVTNLNNALKDYPDLLNSGDVETLLRNLDSYNLPAAVRQAVINNGGGHANHTLFWNIMGPNGGGEPAGALADAIASTFGSFAELQKTINANGAGRFGSGWSWLVQGQDGKLKAYNTLNQDSPLLQGDTPLLGVDVWEHAYYLKYKNVRADYLTAWWNTVNWTYVSGLFQG